MLLDNKIYKAEISTFINNFKFEYSLLDNKTVLISGGTGLIGSTLINTLLFIKQKFNYKINIIVLARNKNKIIKMFGKDFDFDLRIFDITDSNLIRSFNDVNIDYIIHTASITSSKKFVDSPCETINTSYLGTKNILELARCNKVKRVLYLSTMEVYGTLLTEDLITEDYPITLSKLDSRSSYPISKIMCETMCNSYSKEYNLDIKTLRLTQTFGPGLDYNDGRVFAEFLRCIIENKDIVLLSKGETKRNYLYTLDAIQAIILLLFNNDKNTVYNVANMNTYCSILEMAQTATKTLNSNSKIIIKENQEAIKSKGYASKLFSNLDTTRICNLGFNPNYNLEHMFDLSYKYLIESMRG